MATSFSFHQAQVLGGLDGSAAFPMLALGACPHRCCGPLGSKFVRFRRHGSVPRRSSAWRIVCCDVKPAKLVRRKCSPYLEGVFLPDANDLVCHEWKAVPDIWKSSADKFGDRLALVDPYHEPPSKFTYKELEQEILNFSQGLRVIGIEPDEKLALFADNSCRWLVADQGIMATGAINVVRGTRSSDEELLQIYKHSESVALVIDSPQYFDRLVGSLIPMIDVRFIIILWGGKSFLKSEAVKNIPLYDYSEIIKLGEEDRKKFDSIREGQKYVYEAINPEDVATLMYTSGTSGTPKGVMLTHRNLLHQIKNLWDIVPVEEGDRFLSMLPSWHAYERAAEYFIFTYGSEQMYTNIKSLREDLKNYRPHYLISVPLVYETLYSSIQKQISAGSTLRKFIAFTLIKASMLYMEAKRIYTGEVLPVKNNQPSSILAFVDWLWARALALLLWPLHKLGMKLVYRKIHVAIGITKAGISGGASLPNHVDRFFEAIGVMIQNGYGLTETSPVVAARRPYLNVVGTAGNPLKHTEFKIIEPETGNILPDGLKGIIKIRGPQVMKGYYKNPVATSEALDEEGWFNTGDIGWIVPKLFRGRSRKCGGLIVIDGRAKDTIVLRTGENVEPAEIEAAAMRSTLIQQIMVIGQDQRLLGALIVPNKDELLALEKRLSILDDNSVLDKNKLVMLLHKELGTWTAGFPFQIGPILVLDEPFTIENGLMTPTMKLRRDKVAARYREEIENLYK